MKVTVERLSGRKLISEEINYENVLGITYHLDNGAKFVISLDSNQKNGIDIHEKTSFGLTIMPGGTSWVHIAALDHNGNIVKN